MSAIVIILPVIRIERFGEDAEDERMVQELRVALADMVMDAPPRTRPVLVVDNARGTT